MNKALRLIDYLEHILSAIERIERHLTALMMPPSLKASCCKTLWREILR